MNLGLLFEHVSLWLRTIPEAREPVSRRTGDAEVGWELALTIRRGDVRPRDLDRVMAAFTDDSKSVVAAMVALTASRLELGIPSEVDLRQYVDADLLAAVDQVIAEQEMKTPAKSDS